MTTLYEPRAYTDAPRAKCAWGLELGWPSIDADMTTDIAIVGAGFTGLNAALTLAQAGHRPLVLDAHAPGWGASGRNGGFCCLGGAGLDDAALAKAFGSAAAEAFLTAERDAIDHVAARLTRHGIDAQCHSDGEIRLAHRPRHARAFPAERDALHARGISARVLTRDDLAAEGLYGPEFHGGLHISAGFALDPGAYMRGLAIAARDAGADIRGDSPVTRLTRADGRHLLKTPHGTVTARQVIVATNGYGAEDLHPWLRGRFLPVQSNVLMTRPLTRAEQEDQGWTSDLMAYDTRTLLHYFRLLPDGRFLFGMRGGIRGTAAADARATGRMIRDFHRMFPAWRDVDIPHTWSGFVNFSARLVPHAGPIDGDPTALVAMAYHGNGVAMASYTGDVAARLLMGEDARPEILAAPMPRFPLPALRRNLLRLAYPGATLRDRL